MQTVLKSMQTLTLALTMVAVVAAVFGFARSADALTPPYEPLGFTVTASGLTVTSSFQRSTPCTPFTIAWGDGKSDVVKSTAEVCTQNVVTQKNTHVYAAAGTYKVSLTVGGQTYTKEVKVAAAVVAKYALTDVLRVVKVNVTSTALDGGYTRYIVTLKNGTKREVKVYGLSLHEMVVKDFRATGYTGDVPALMAKAVWGFYLSNVASITKANSVTTVLDGPVLYTITLKNGRKVEVKVPGLALESMVVKLFRDAGYLGNVTELLSKVGTGTAVTPFALTDVKSVTQKQVDPIPNALDDEYTLYTITLKSGKVVEVKNYGFAPAEMNNKAFKDAGYTGDIAALKAMATTVTPVTPPVVTPFALIDVKSVTVRIVNADSAAVDAAYQLFTITLKSGTVIEVKNFGNGTAEMNNKAFRDAGYTGDIAALRAMATTTTATTFGLLDVKSITSKYVDPSPMMADEEYTLYTITLKSGKVVTVKAFAFGTVEMRNKAFKDAGYTGDVAALLKLVVVLPSPINPGVVQGATLTDIRAALDEILSEALKLQAAVAAL